MNYIICIMLALGIALEVVCIQKKNRKVEGLPITG